MHFITDPMSIETKSMEIIRPYLKDYTLSKEQEKVYSRIIHASGDPEYAKVISIHPQAIEAGCSALRAGKDIFCDVEMVRTGINKKILSTLGGSTHCLIGDDSIAIEAKKQGVTRSMMAMRSFGRRMDGSIIAIGNAPTALFEVLRLIEETGLCPALIIGVPVGFVGASESKELLVQSSPVPYITVKGNKGGSPIAASATNALLYMIDR